MNVTKVTDARYSYCSLVHLYWYINNEHDRSISSIAFEVLKPDSNSSKQPIARFSSSTRTQQKKLLHIVIPALRRRDPPLPNQKPQIGSQRSQVQPCSQASPPRHVTLPRVGIFPAELQVHFVEQPKSSLQFSPH